MRLTVSIDIIKSNLTLSIDRLLSISYFSSSLLCTLEPFPDRHDKPSKLQRSISQHRLGMLNAHRQL